MEQYIVCSTFTVANQIVRIELNGAHGVCAVELPVKWAQYLTTGDTFKILRSRTSGVPLAYVFNNQMYFPHPVIMESQARRIISACRTLREFSLEYIKFQYALSRAMQLRGIRVTSSCVKNIMALYRANMR